MAFTPRKFLPRDTWNGLRLTLASPERILAWSSGEVARNAKGPYFDGSCNLARVIEDCRIDEANRRAIMIRFILPYQKEKKRVFDPRLLFNWLIS